jgi:hypothetical protein
MAMAAPIWFCGNNADIGLRAQPLGRAVATSAINHDHFIRSRSDKFAHLFHQKVHEEKCVVTDGDDTYWPRHFCFVYLDPAIS